MTMLLRRQMMRNAGGWTKTIYTATADTLKGNTTTAALRAVLPTDYHYAVAIADDISSPETYAFIGCILLPEVSKVIGFRMAADKYAVLSNMESSSIDARIRTGQTVSIWWRNTPISGSSDMPSAGWNYDCIQPGAMTNASQTKTALTDVGTFEAMLAVADLDYNTPPAVNNTHCVSATLNSQNMTGSYLRYRDNAYVAGSNWGANYDLVTESTTKIACFYI